MYWDTFGYVAQAISGQVGGLGFGRPVFALLSHGLAGGWLAAGGSPWLVEPWLRVFWMAVSCTAAPLTWRLALLCGMTPRAAVLAGLAVAASPAMAHASGAVLTDGAATVGVLLAAVWGVRAVGAPSAVASGSFALASGAALGLAIGAREQTVANVAMLALLVLAAPPPRRRRIAAAMGLSCALVTAAPMVVVLLTQPGYLDTIRGWFDGMAHDRQLKTYGWRDLALLAAWVVSLGPAIVVASVPAYLRTRSPVWRLGTVLAAIVLPSIAQLLWMGTFQGITYSPRYLLPALPGALAIPGALVLDRWIGRRAPRLVIVSAGLIAPLLMAAPFVHRREASIEATVRALPSMLAALPARSVIVSGQPCPAVAMVRQLVAVDTPAPSFPPDWQTVCPGWAWPDDLPARLDAALEDGRTVVLDLRPTSWLGAEQQAALAQAIGYRRDRDAAEATGAVIVWE